MTQTVLVLVPHPDDAEFHAGGTLVKMAQEGKRVIVVIATDGGCGSLAMDRQALIQTRAEEARRGAQALGAEAPILLGYPDMGLDMLPPGQLREQFIRLIRQYRPQTAFAEDPFAPNQVHPDHRAVAWAASDAIHIAHLPLVHPEHIEAGLQPHFVIEKYFFSDVPAAGNKIVDITATIDRKIDALAKHGSQMEFLVREVAEQAKLAGLDLAGLLGEATNDPVAIVAWVMRTQASEIGLKIGVQFGEAYRYTRFHPFIESLLSNAIT